jgi:hypothetical protein
MKSTKVFLIVTPHADLRLSGRSQLIAEWAAKAGYEVRIECPKELQGISLKQVWVDEFSTYEINQ